MKNRTNVMGLGGQNDRITVYDWLRLIATIFVVIGHSAYLTIKTTYGGVAYELPTNVNHIYSSAVLTWLRFLSGWCKFRSNGMSIPLATA